MNKRIAIPITIIAMMMTPLALAAPATSSATPQSLNNKIADLKERLATKVAELRKTTPKAIFGTVSSVSLSSFIVDTQSKAIKIELNDNLKVVQYLKGKRTALTTDDISKGDVVTVFGNYDVTLDVLNATKVFIEASKLPIRISGFISEIDKKNNSLTVKGFDNSSYNVDIEVGTKTLTWTPDKGIDKSGFSKLETGIFVSVLGLPDAKNQTNLTALRILHFKVKPDATPTVTSSPSATPSTQPTKNPKSTATPSQ